MASNTSQSLQMLTVSDDFWLRLDLEFTASPLFRGGRGILFSRAQRCPISNRSISSGAHSRFLRHRHASFFLLRARCKAHSMQFRIIDIVRMPLISSRLRLNIHVSLRRLLRFFPIVNLYTIMSVVYFTVRFCECYI